MKSSAVELKIQTDQLFQSGNHIYYNDEFICTLYFIKLRFSLLAAVYLFIITTLTELDSQ